MSGSSGVLTGRYDAASSAGLIGAISTSQPTMNSPSAYVSAAWSPAIIATSSGTG